MSGSSPASTTTAVSRTDEQIQPGTNVIGACGHKIGEVMDVQKDYFVVEQGFFISHDLYIPKSAIARHDKHGIHLNATKLDSRRSDWTIEPGS